MSEQLPYSDIVILALIAGFILLRLRSVLGQKGEGDDYRASPPPRTDEPVVRLPDRLRRQEEEKIIPASVEAPMEETAGDGIAAIRAADAAFNPASFLQGAKIAFEMVFDAFTKGDKTMLKTLLAAEVYDDFASEIDARKTQETRSETTLISVEEQRIAAAEKTGQKARVTVHFVSEQINVVRDKEGKIIEGDPSQVERVEDEWTFEREINSRDPNWKIVAV